MPRERSSYSSGLLYGLIAYGLWGLFPLYFSLFDGVSPLEVVAHRIVWSLVFIVIVLLFMRKWRSFIAVFRDKRSVGLLALAAIFIAINWGTYVYAIESDHVVQASLGYLINPLVSVALGVIVLRERLRNLQWVAVAIAAIAVIYLTFATGAFPWISLTLAFSFAMYGLAKKLAGVDAVQSLGVETALLTPIAMLFMIVMVGRHNAAFPSSDLRLSVLLMLLGPVTAIPLLAFGAATNRIPLSTLGLMQYITPLLQFIIGVYIFGEVMSLAGWIGFAIVWVAVLIFAFDTVKHRNDHTKLSENIEALEVSDTA